MKLIDNKNKLICCVAIVLLVIAVIIVALKGFNVDLKYKAHEEIDIVIGKDFELSDVREITNNVFGNKKVYLRKIEVFEDAVAIDVENTTEDELNALKDKFNEFYGTELEKVTPKQIANERIFDLVKPFIVPVIISSIIVFVYVGIKYRKLDKKAIVVAPANLCIALSAIEVILLSVVAIARIPFNKLVVPVMLVCGFVYMMVWICNGEKLLEAGKEKE